MIVAIVQQILGVVEPSAWEPTGSRHLIAILQDRRCGPLSLYIGKVRHLEPECVRSFERPTMQCRVITRWQIAPRRDAIDETTQIAVGHARGGGAPEYVLHLASPERSAQPRITATGRSVPIRLRAWSSR